MIMDKLDNYIFLNELLIKIKLLNDSGLRLEVDNISVLCYFLTGISEVSVCDLLAYDAISMLEDAGLLVYDYGYKVLPVL